MTQAEALIYHGVRSGLEEDAIRQLEESGKFFTYESIKLSFIQPEKKRSYTPDLLLNKKNKEGQLIIELKGRFTPEDRKKMKLIKEQYPDLDIRIVFNNPNAKISKTSKTTYAKWCEKEGFRHAKFPIPRDWLDECD